MGVRIGGSIGPISVSAPLVPRNSGGSGGALDMAALVVVAPFVVGKMLSDYGNRKRAKDKHGAGFGFCEPGDVVEGRMLNEDATAWVPLVPGDIVNGHIMQQDGTWLPGQIVNGHILNADRTEWVPFRTSRIVNRNPLEVLFDEAIAVDRRCYMEAAPMREAAFNVETATRIQKRNRAAQRELRQIQQLIAEQRKLVLSNVDDDWVHAQINGDYHYAMGFIEGLGNGLAAEAKQIDVNVARVSRGLPALAW